MTFAGRDKVTLEDGVIVMGLEVAPTSAPGVLVEMRRLRGGPLAQKPSK